MIRPSSDWVIHIFLFTIELVSWIINCIQSKLPLRVSKDQLKEIAWIFNYIWITDVLHYVCWRLSLVHFTMCLICFWSTESIQNLMRFSAVCYNRCHVTMTQDETIGINLELWHYSQFCFNKHVLFRRIQCINPVALLMSSGKLQQQWNCNCFSRSM